MGGAWINSIFRNEGRESSSDLIREAVAVVRGQWPDVPELGLVTFVDKSKVRSAKPNRRGKCRGPGYCYLKAGFRQVGETKGGLLAFRLYPSEMPPALHLQVPLF